MGLPIIATNWSGPTAFMSATTGFPLDYTLVDVPPHMELDNHRWAEPSVTHLRHNSEDEMRVAWTRASAAPSLHKRRLAVASSP